jgi:hypothetical protein
MHNLNALPIRGRAWRRLLAALTVTVLGGCGAVVPELDPGATPLKNEIYIRGVATNVRCHLQQAVQDAYGKREAPWLKDWSAKISLTLTVDEAVNLNPGVTLTQILPNAITTFPGSASVTTGQSRGLGLGGAFKADANRVLVITWFVLFSDILKAPPLVEECRHVTPYSVQGDLKIAEGLFSGLWLADTIGIASDPFKSGGPLQVIEHHVSFEATFSANVTPTWKLVNVSANPTGTFLTGTRTRKDDLLISMGPTSVEAKDRPLIGSKEKKDKNIAAQPKGGARTVVVAVPSNAVENSHLAAQIGQAVSNALLQAR